MENNNKLSRKNIFIVPDRYFDKLEADIQEKTKKPARASISILKSPAWKLAMAASVLLIGSFYFFSQPEPSADPQALLAQVSDDELLRYLEENTLPETDDILNYSEYTEDEILTLDFSGNNDSIF